MLKNPRVARIKADYKSGICMVYMENGEVYRKNNITGRRQLRNYLRELVNEDGLVIRDASECIFTDGDTRMDRREIDFLMD